MNEELTECSKEYLIKQLEYSYKEIERLKEELKYTVPLVEHNKTISKHIKEKVQLRSIIKEVREKIRNINIIYLGVRGGKTFTQKSLIDILEILDKENNKTKEVMSVEELEEYEPKNMAEQEYQDWFWEGE